MSFIWGCFNVVIFSGLSFCIFFYSVPVKYKASKILPEYYVTKVHMIQMNRCKVFSLLIFDEFPLFAVTFMKYHSKVSLIFLLKTLIWNKIAFPASNSLNFTELVKNELRLHGEIFFMKKFVCSHHTAKVLQ